MRESKTKTKLKFKKRWKKIHFLISEINEIEIVDKRVNKRIKD